MRRRTLLFTAALVATGCTPRRAPNQPEPTLVFADPAADVRSAAERAADAVAAGETPPDGVFTAAAPLPEIFAGMGAIRPKVSVEQAVIDHRGERGTAQLVYEWTIRPGQPPWSYSVPVTAVRESDGAWRVEWTPAVIHLELEAGESLRLSNLPSRRAEIIGADDERLVYRQAVVRVGIDMTYADRETALASARPLANELAIDPDRYYRRVQKAGRLAFVEAQVLRIGDEAHRDAIERVRDLPGVRLIDSERLLAVTPEFARPILGIVGEATAEIIEKSNGAIREGDIVGLSGLQAQRDQELRGAAGFVIERRPSGAVLQRTEPVRGRPVTLTIKVATQREAEKRVAVLADPCGVVVVRIADGHVRAAASGRGSKGFSTATLARVVVPPPERAQATLAALGWDAPDSAGIPVVRGELSGRQAVCSPLGVALAAASAAAGERVSPQLVVEGTAPERPPLGDAAGDVAAWVAEIGKRPGWSVVTTAEFAIVGYVEGGDAGPLTASGITG